MFYVAGDHANRLLFPFKKCPGIWLAEQCLGSSSKGSLAQTSPSQSCIWTAPLNPIKHFLGTHTDLLQKLLPIARESWPSVKPGWLLLIKEQLTFSTFALRFLPEIIFSLIEKCLHDETKHNLLVTLGWVEI